MARREITGALSRLQDQISDLKRDAHRNFVRETPVRTGNARKNTVLKGDQIQANYPYSVRLEKQSWSRQAPNGMSEPTIEQLRAQIRRTFG